MVISDCVPKRYRGATVDTLPLVVREQVKAWVPTMEVLLLSGPTGTGKTWAAAAAAMAWQAWMAEEAERRAAEEGYHKSPRNGLVWADVPTLAGVLRDMDEGEDVTGRCRGVPLLVLDDLGAHKASEYITERLYDVVNHRYSWEKPLIVTTNLSLVQMGQMWPRMASRLCSGTVIATAGRDLRLVPAGGR